MVDDYEFCMKTSGTSGKSKWFAHGSEFLKLTLKYTVAYLVISCSDNWGDLRIKEGDRVICMIAPPPYGSSFVVRAWENLFECLPPPQIMENITSMRKKINTIAKIIRNEGKIDYISGLPSTLHLIAAYLTTPEKVFQERYQAMNLSVPKLILYLKYLQSKISPPKHKKVSDMISIKGLNIGGRHYGLYLDSLIEQYGVDPYNIYASSEASLALIGSLKRKHNFISLLEVHYYEFMEEDGTIRKIHELEKGKMYTLVITPVNDVIVRHNTGDIFKVVDFEDNGLPVLSFESRANDLIDLYGYLYLSESLAGEALRRAGLQTSDKWAIAKLINPSEHLLLLMEKSWDYSEDEASRAVFNSLADMSEDFRNLIRDFEIERSDKCIKVEYLPRGAFTRYTMKKIKEGAPFGQVKPPKLINPEKAKMIQTLRTV